jgi:hypothetical protein
MLLETEAVVPAADCAAAGMAVSMAIAAAPPIKRAFNEILPGKV